MDPFTCWDQYTLAQRYESTQHQLFVSLNYTSEMYSLRDTYWPEYAILHPQSRDIAWLYLANAVARYSFLQNMPIFKGSLTRDFRLQVFFMNQCPPGLQVFHLSHFEFFRKFAEIFAN
jgi:hypothetical protein